MQNGMSLFPRAGGGKVVEEPPQTLHGDVVEEVANALPVVGAADGLGEGARDVDDAQLGAAVDLVAEGRRVGDDEAAEDRAVDGVDGVTRENAAVSTISTHRTRPSTKRPTQD